MPDRAHRPQVPESQQHQVLVESPRSGNRVTRVAFTVAIDRDLRAGIDDGNLHELFRVNCLGGTTLLLSNSLSPAEEVTAGHPSLGDCFAKHDGIEILTGLHREQAASALSQVGYRRPGHERLVAQWRRRGAGSHGRSADNPQQDPQEAESCMHGKGLLATVNSVSLVRSSARQ